MGFDYISFDSLYGSSYELLHTLDRTGYRFIGDVRASTQVFTQKPTFYLPQKEPGKGGPAHKIPVTDSKTVTVGQYLESLETEDMETIAFREGTRQKVTAHFHQKSVWICTDHKAGQVLALRLLIRKEDDGTVKYSLSNLLDEPLQAMACRQGQRVFVERIFEEGKNQLGMGDYQVRSWHGFHKHMTRCFMAFYYAAVQKIKYQDQLPLTTAVIRKLVAATIVSRWEKLDTTIACCLDWLHQYQHQIRANLEKNKLKLDKVGLSPVENHHAMRNQLQT